MTRKEIEARRREAKRQDTLFGIFFGIPMVVGTALLFILTF